MNIQTQEGQDAIAALAIAIDTIELYYGENTRQSEVRNALENLRMMKVAYLVAQRAAVREPAAPKAVRPNGYEINLSYDADGNAIDLGHR